MIAKINEIHLNGTAKVVYQAFAVHHKERVFIRSLIQKVYKQFVKMDAQEELSNSLGLKQSEQVLRVWNIWYRIHPILFEKWIWKASGSAKVLQDIIDITGTLNMSLRFLKVLKDEQLIEISSDGNIRFHEVLKKWHKSKSEFAELEELRKRNDNSYGQFQVDWVSSQHRALFINQEIPKWQRIFFCGDDDYTSLALSEYGEREIYVGDIDPDVLANIKNMKNKYDLSIKTAHFDVSEPSPPELQNKFQAFHCDPLDSGKGLDLWMARADELLTGDVGDTIFVNISIERLGRRVLYFQNYLSTYGYYLDKILRNQNQYKVIEEPFFQKSTIEKRLDELGLDMQVIEDSYIHTDLFMFVRAVEKPILLPQEYFELRRKI